MIIDRLSRLFCKYVVFVIVCLTLLATNSVAYTFNYNNVITNSRQNPYAVAKIYASASFICPCPGCCGSCASCQQQTKPPIVITEFFNPCPYGKPYLTATGTPFFCSTSQCPANFWCHMGATDATTCCCPGNSENVCNTPPLAGTGNAALIRFYFDSRFGKCQPFIYRGLMGNQNNFPTMETCQAACTRSIVETINICNIGQPLTDLNGKYYSCAVQGTCSANYWCHYGIDNDHTVCCPSAQPDPCLLPCLNGQGSYQISRWFYNPMSKQCEAFYYRGFQGNQNNFITNEECIARCQTSIQNPCGQGYVVRDGIGQPVDCGNFLNSCPAQTWCHIGAPEDKPLCCSDAIPNFCDLRVTQGYGKHALKRWYFNTESRICEPFWYRSLGGNQNNFLAEDECQRSCQRPDNPCLIGIPPMGSNNRPLACIFKGGCPLDHWCHFSQTTVCCPGELQMACTGLPPIPGVGSDNFIRWYYDAPSRQCQKFTYKGSKGNQNNFLTKEDCENTCSISVEGPCAQKSPFTTSCSEVDKNCPAGQWCHIGSPNDSKMSVCCAGAVDNVCQLPVMFGPGNSVLTRWYFNQISQRCESFIYTGTMGNQNNFLAYGDCKMKCEGKKSPDVCPLGIPLTTMNNDPLSCSRLGLSSTCPLGYWCHVGDSPATTVCCAKTTDNACALTPSNGQGTNPLDRFYYDPSQKRCLNFTYYGSKGNENNFDGYETCEASCGEYTNPCIGQPATSSANQTILCSATNKAVCPVNFWCHVGATIQTTLCCPGATLPCSVPLAPGTGPTRLQRWYYVADTRTCQQFEYLGLGGNQNNFETLSECERTCPSELCALSIDTGSTLCNKVPEKRYAYDRDSGGCREFWFTGCGGNLNNFVSMLECSNICGKTAYRRRKMRA